MQTHPTIRRVVTAAAAVVVATGLGASAAGAVAGHQEGTAVHTSPRPPGPVPTLTLTPPVGSEGVTPQPEVKRPQSTLIVDPGPWIFFGSDPTVVPEDHPWLVYFG